MSIKAAMDDFISDVKSISFSSQIPSKPAKQSDEANTMKTKFIESWHNFKFDLGSGTSVKKDSPLWLLGKYYHMKMTSPKPNAKNSPSNSQEQQNTECDPLHMFLMDYISKPWFTYRKGFPPLEDGLLTSDTGWGCMLRSTQMMMAQCFITHFLGRQWRWLESTHTLEESKLHRTIIKWFVDDPNPNCPFSIHKLTEIGLGYRFTAGDWYGPGTAAYIMQDATECAKGTHPLLDQLVVYVSQDCTVYTEDVIEVCHWRPHQTPNGTEANEAASCSTSAQADSGGSLDGESPPPRSAIILIPVRLGEASLNPIYSPCLQAMLTLDQCMGIVGGKPRHSLYFIGFQDDHLFYLDPHYCRQADSATTFGNKELDNYHNMSPRKTHISKLDPSCCLCFYCRDLDDFNDFVAGVNKLLAPPNQRTSYPLCLILEGSARQHKVTRERDASACSVLSPDKAGFTEIRLNSPEPDPEPEPKPEPETEEVKRDSSKLSALKLGKFLPTPRSVIGFYRQHSRSPKTRRKADDKSFEEDFEFL